MEELIMMKKEAMEIKLKIMQDYSDLLDIAISNEDVSDETTAEIIAYEALIARCNQNLASIDYLINVQKSIDVISKLEI